jgi:Protein of unknown function (DUF1573)
MLRAAFAIVCPLAFLAGPLHAELVWEKSAQNYHRSPSDGHVEAKFAFRNQGKTPVTVRKVRTSCDCTSAKLPKNTFDPGEQGEITVRFTFGDRKGPYRKIISVITDDKPAPTDLSLQVWIQESLTIAPALVFWKTGAASDTRAVQLTAAPGTPVRVKSVTSSNPRLAAKLETIKPGGQYVVSVTPADTSKKESAEITVETDFPADAPRSYTIHARIK